MLLLFLRSYFLSGRSGSCVSLLIIIFTENTLGLLLLYSWVNNVASITGADN